MRKVGIDPDNPGDVTIVPQQFDMNAFLGGEIDAAQAMIYNEYAQVLESKNPETGELYQPDDLDVVTMEAAGTAMLQDAIFASEAWLAEEGNEDVAVRFLKAAFRGWMYCRDNHAECVDIVLKYDAALPKGHQTWMMNEINALIWPSPNGIGLMDEAAFDRTVQIAVEGKILTQEPEGTAFRNDLAQQALDALEGDKTGESWTKAEVELTEGGK
jgi:NitT/TauT family transport system substrate-binding protein